MLLSSLHYSTWTTVVSLTDGSNNLQSIYYVITLNHPIHHSNPICFPGIGRKRDPVQPVPSRCCADPEPTGGPGDPLSSCEYPLSLWGDGGDQCECLYCLDGLWDSLNIEQLDIKWFLFVYNLTAWYIMLNISINLE